MLHLRSGFKVNGRPLAAADLDRLADASDDDTATPEVAQLLDAVKQRAALLVAAGMQTQLSLGLLSQYELQCLAAARADIARRDRETLAGLIGMAVGRPDAFAMIPDDELTEAIKWKLHLVKRGAAMLGGGGPDGAAVNTHGDSAGDQSGTGSGGVASGD